MLAGWLVLAGWVVPCGAQRNLKNIPDPDPELERKSFVIDDVLEVNLFAADPLMAKPIQMNFDAEGRLWIASSEVYPHIKPGQTADDKILVLEDRNHDGTADKTTVFARGLLIPTGVVPGDGGAYVANSTELIHLSDQDGDGQADRKRVVLSGFGTEDTHHLLHTLRWGPDGALYMNQSIYIHSHVETPFGVRRLNGGGIWRFRPESMELEILCRGFVNPWGHHFDDWGQSFATDGAYGEGINYVFPGAVFVTAPGAKRRVEGLNPGSPKHCGLERISGRHFPPEWRGNLITNDFRAHRVCRFVLEEQAAGYSSRQENELIKTSHVAFRPIDAKMGPDGALYIADWYNPIIQHGEVDFRDPRRDHVHGRIWRVTYKGRSPLKHPPIVGASVENLLELLRVPEQWVRLQAKLELKHRDPDQVVAAVKRWLSALESDPPETREPTATAEHARLEALWVLDALDRADPELLERLLRSPDHRVRAAAVRVLSHRPTPLDKLAELRRAVTDDHPRVRLEAVRALAEMPQVEAAVAALLALEFPLDRFLDFALWQTMRDLAPVWLPLVKEGKLAFGGDARKLTFALAAVDSPEVTEPLLKLLTGRQIAAENAAAAIQLVAGTGTPPQLAQAVELLVAEPAVIPTAQRAEVLESLLAASRRRKVRPAGDLAAVAKLLEAPSPAVQALAVRAAGVWKLSQYRGRLLELSGTQTESVALRQAAIAGLAELGDAPAQQALKTLANSRDRSLDDRVAAVAGLSGSATSAAAQAAVELMAAEAEVDVARLLAALLDQRQGPAQLRAALADKRLAPDVAKLALRAAQAAAKPDAELIAALRSAGALTAGGWKLDVDQLQALAAEVAQRGDPVAGEAVYRRAQLQCLNCHAIGGAGGRVGPDLISIGASAQVDYLIESLIEPNKKVKENFHSLLVETDEGRVLSGIPVRKSERELVLRDAKGQEVVIPVERIEQQREGRSLMPDGLVDSLTRDELVDLVRFLSELGKGEWAVGKTRLVRAWEVLQPTPEAQFRIRRTSFDRVTEPEPVFQWLPAFSRVQGTLPLDEYPAFQPAALITRTKRDRVQFVRFPLTMSAGGEVELHLDMPLQGISLWVDGKPTPPAQQLKLALGPGRHLVTFAVVWTDTPPELKVELR